jgi:23S rRNA (pseudouridine1915-N3)-methyltransferase
MKSLHLISVGKNKDKNFLSLESDYIKRMNSFSFHLHEVKSCEENLDLEAKNVLKKVDTITKSEAATVILLTEKGQKYNSPDFSTWLFNLLQKGSVIMIIGGASGHGQELYERFHSELSLSALTMPHKLARLTLVEQIYRAQTIHQSHPYHK